MGVVCHESAQIAADGRDMEVQRAGESAELRVERTKDDLTVARWMGFNQRKPIVL